MTMEVKGRDLVAGIPKTVVVSSDEIREALQEPINAIVEAVLIALEALRQLAGEGPLSTSQVALRSALRDICGESAFLDPLLAWV